MELRNYFGQSGKVYFVTWSEETHWHAFLQTKEGFTPVEAKAAAIDCGAIGDRQETTTHKFWQQIWK
jgi:hypothetical protein